MFYSNNNHDSNGHLAGDKLLHQCGQILKDSVRGSDLVARYGGEEFVLILPNADRENAGQLAERIREQISEYPFKGRENQPSGSLTASLGVSTYPRDGETGRGIVRGRLRVR